MCISTTWAPLCLFKYHLRSTFCLYPTWPRVSVSRHTDSASTLHVTLGALCDLDTDAGETRSDESHHQISSTPRDQHGLFEVLSFDTINGWMLESYVLATSKVILGWVQTVRTHADFIVVPTWGGGGRALTKLSRCPSWHDLRCCKDVKLQQPTNRISAKIR